jgi:hypothetical protein
VNIETPDHMMRRVCRDLKVADPWNAKNVIRQWLAKCRPALV